MDKVKVEVTEEGAGLKFLAANRKALPPQREGALIEVQGGPYVRSLIEDGYVRPLDDDLPPEEVEEAPHAIALTDVTGIGPATAERLNEADVATVKQLSDADPELLATAIGSKADTVRDWQTAAAELLEEEGE